MVEYHIILNIVYRDGSTTKNVVRCSTREASISKYNYLKNLLDHKDFRELKAWTHENLYVEGIVESIEGLLGVSYIKVLP